MKTSKLKRKLYKMKRRGTLHLLIFFIIILVIIFFASFCFAEGDKYKNWPKIEGYSNDKIDIICRDVIPEWNYLYSQPVFIHNFIPKTKLFFEKWVADKINRSQCYDKKEVYIWTEEERLKKQYPQPIEFREIIETEDFYFIGKKGGEIELINKNLVIAILFKYYYREILCNTSGDIISGRRDNEDDFLDLIKEKMELKS